MSKPKRTPLSADQLADAERLRDIYKKRVQESKARGDDPPLNQTEVGERCEWKSPQSAVSQFLRGTVALNLEALIKLSKALDFEPYEVSPTLAGDVRRAASLGESKITPSAEIANTPLPVGGEPSVDLDDRYAFVPQYTARAAAGLGRANPHVEIRSTLAFKREWLKVKGVKPENLIVIYAEGQSMWPTIDNGDVLLVDCSGIEPAHGQVFVLAHGEHVIVKRLVSAGITWLLRSDNEDKAKYQDRVYTLSEENEHRIVGRVVWRGGDL